MNDNKGIIERFHQDLIDNFLNYKPDPVYEQRCKEYHDTIATEFEREWSKKKLKFLLKKRRQEKLRNDITLKYYHLNPLFYLIESTVEEIFPKPCNEEWFAEFISFD